MTVTDDESTGLPDSVDTPDDGAEPAGSGWPSPLAIAAVASIGAGGIHAAVVGGHGDHKFLAALFVWTAACQVCWGIATLLAPHRLLTVVGVAVNVGTAGAWMVTRLVGISWIDGLEVRENLQFSDGAAAFLALVAAGIAFGALLTPRSALDHRTTNLAVPAFLVAALALPAMVSTSTHQHSTATGDHGHSATTVSSSHDHGTNSAVTFPPNIEIDRQALEELTGTTVATRPTESTVPAAVVPPTPYDPTKPIDLSGVDGVTPEQQARAENLIAITLARLPKFADPAAATELGWKSIGDGLTGYEHFINWSLLDDGRILDPDFPESLVYRVQADGSKQLVSAMFMLGTGTTLADVPDVGGKLMQWHIHDNLCFTAGDGAPRVAGLTRPDGSCPAPLVKGAAVPMIHVWIVPHPCGPFAALEGVGAGQIAEGEERWCDHAHGSTTFG